ncbi:sister chromatid cohesion protein 1 [Rhizophlyctis rosea]|uniref:Sister chromatid cohesion protein 1 n=1 Tax=Rhizophlyctis rosea TaxID=64517 RepID=A0AAD5X8R1_9FUNG|nr:sister chromatid cohesion protein 1 [Rhizophlyctis rosea]
MFYSTTILQKKGSLAKVWLAANWERRLTKSQTMQTNIQKAVEEVIVGEAQPYALRLTGHLLFGVVKIYSRKARYLLEDCNEALMKIKMAFRPGIVDMPTDHAIANVNAITLVDTMTEFDILLPEPSFDLRSFLAQDNEADLGSGPSLLSRSQDSMLSSEHGSFEGSFMLDGQQEDLRDIFGIPDTQQQEDEGQWDLTFGGDDPLPAGDQPSASMDDSMEIEVGRDAVGEQPFSPGHRDSLSMADESFAAEKRGSLPDISMDLGGGLQDDPLLGAGDDLGLNLDQPVTFMELDRQNDADDQPFPDLPGTPADIRDESFQVPTSVQAKAGSREAPDVDNTPKAQRKKAPKKRKHIVDEQTELSTDFMKRQLEYTDDILVEQRFVPASRKMQKLMDIRKQGAGYFLGLDRYDIPKQFRHLLVPRPRRRVFEVSRRAAGDSPRKRKADEVEERRESDDFQLDFGAGPSGDLPQPFDHPAGDFVESFDTTVEPVPEATELPREDVEEDEVPLQKKRRTGEEDEVPTEEEDREEGVVFEDDTQDQPDDSGFSKSTVRTVKTLQSKFDAQEGEEKELSFDKLTSKAKRTDAVKLFFELLVLKTRDMVHVEQEEAYGDIKITPKDTFYSAVLSA